MSDGLGNWVGKEVKVEWILKIRETCMTCMCLVCVMCVSKGNNTGSNGKDSLTGLPNPAEMWDSGNRGVEGKVGSWRVLGGGSYKWKCLGCDRGSLGMSWSRCYGARIVDGSS